MLVTMWAPSISKSVINVKNSLMHFSLLLVGQRGLNFFIWDGIKNDELGACLSLQIDLISEVTSLTIICYKYTYFNSVYEFLDELAKFLPNTTEITCAFLISTDTNLIGIVECCPISKINNTDTNIVHLVINWIFWMTSVFFVLSRLRLWWHQN